MKQGIHAAVAVAALSMMLVGCSVAEQTTPQREVETVAAVPDEALVRAGHLTTCMDMPYQPFQ